MNVFLLAGSTVQASGDEGKMLNAYPDLRNLFTTVGGLKQNCDEDIDHWHEPRAKTRLFPARNVTRRIINQRR